MTQEHTYNGNLTKNVGFLFVVSGYVLDFQSFAYFHGDIMLSLVLYLHAISNEMRFSLQPGDKTESL